MPRFRQYLLAVISPLLIACTVCGVLWATSSRPSGLILTGGPRDLFSVDPSPIVKFSAKEGETVAVEFTVKNITNQPVRVLGTNTSCGCTAVTNSFPMDFAAGVSHKLLIQMKVGQPGPDGKFVQQANLLVNRAGTVPALALEASVAETK